MAWPLKAKEENIFPPGSVLISFKKGAISRLVADTISMFINGYICSNKYTMVFITRKEHFNAAHKLHREDWSKEKNEEVFGKCANPNWHGHNYALYVTVKGNVNPDTGFLV